MAGGHPSVQRALAWYARNNVQVARPGRGVALGILDAEISKRERQLRQAQGDLEFLKDQREQIYERSEQ